MKPHKVYASPNIIRVIKSREMGWGACDTINSNDTVCTVNCFISFYFYYEASTAVNSIQNSFLLGVAGS
jgi:hypothetical protein